MTQLLGQCEQTRAIAQRREPGEGLAALMCRELPRPALVGEAKPGAEAPELNADPCCRWNLQQLGLSLMPLGRAIAAPAAQPELFASGDGAVPGGQRFEHRHRLHRGGRCDPLVGAPVVARLALEDRPDDHGHGLAGALGASTVHAAGLQMQDLAHARADQVGDDDEATGVEQVGAPDEFADRPHGGVRIGDACTGTLQRACRPSGVRVIGAATASHGLPIRLPGAQDGGSVACDDVDPRRSQFLTHLRSLEADPSRAQQFVPRRGGRGGGSARQSREGPTRDRRAKRRRIPAEGLAVRTAVEGSLSLLLGGRGGALRPG